MAKVDTILEEIKGLTLLEASDLVKKMEEAFGVSAAAATVVAGGGGGGGGAAPGGGKKRITQWFSRSRREKKKTHTKPRVKHKPGLPRTPGHRQRPLVYPRHSCT